MRQTTSCGVSKWKEYQFNIFKLLKTDLEQKKVKGHTNKAIKGIQIFDNHDSLSKYRIKVTTAFKVIKTKNPVSRVILIMKSSGDVAAPNALAGASMS